ncbi:MAG: SH3 domain-containing protein [Gammaproteobacteria bacterium]
MAVGDVLNIRAAPSSNADDVGDLAAGAQPIEVLEIDPTGGWGRLLWDEADAWVSMRYLAPVDVPRLSGRARGAHAST